MKCEEKKRFTSMFSAERRAKEISSSNLILKVDNPPLRAYKCEMCGGHHLTSQPKK